MVPGPRGLDVDPSLSQEDGYSAGVGSQKAEEMGMDGVDSGESEAEETENGKKGKTGKGKKAKGNWKEAVQKTNLKKDAGQLITSLTAISCVGPERDLHSLVEHFTSPLSDSLSVPGSSVPESEWIIGSSDSTTTRISNLMARIEAITLNTRGLEFRRMIFLMQLAILVD